MYRTSHEVVSKAIIYGTLGFRASLEVTEHPRSKSLCSQLLPWVEWLNLHARLEDLHREILEAPYQTLTREFQTEAYWRGEAASVLGWAIQVFERPNPVTFTDAGLFVSNLKILQPDISQLIASATFRPQAELDDFCAFCLTVRHQFQASVLPRDGQDVLKRIHQSRLVELGLSEAFHRLSATDLATVLTSSAASIKGLYVVRGQTAEWLLGKDQ